MAFQIASENHRGTAWYPIDAAGTIYHGQIVESQGDGVAEIDNPNGAFDTTGNTNVLGIVVGDNNATPVYDSTYKVNKITGVLTQATQIARNWSGHEGRMYPKGDPQALVEVALVGPETVICGPVRDNDIDANITLLTVTTETTDGLSSMVINACDFTPVGDLETMHCRTGANKGLYRITTDTSTTAPAGDLAWPEDVSVGDTLVRVPFRQGMSYVYIDSLAMYIDASVAPASHFYGVNVVDMDLSTAGEEKVWFTFSPVHFGRD